MPPKKPVKKRAATLADVGKEAGVSVMAVSAVINGARTSSRISDATRERILAAAKKLSYRPNAAARALADRRMNTIGVVSRVDAGELNHYFVNLFNGILEAASIHKQNTTVFALEDWDQDAHRLQSICDGRIDGAILLAPQFHGKKAPSLPEHTPFVTIHANLDIPGAINFESDEEDGAFKMVQYLTERGHQRILHVSGPLDFRGGRRRLDGYKRALEEASIQLDPDLIIQSNFSATHARESFRKWLGDHQGQPMPDAIFCGNDAMAIGCSQVLADFGLRVPQDVSLAGFDDIILCRSTLPPLSSISQPLREMGAKATETLLSLIDEKSLSETDKTRNIVFDTNLVLRESIADYSGSSPIIPVA